MHLAVQTVVCTEFEDADCTTGNSSDSIGVKILNTRPSKMIGDSSIDTMFIASIIFLAASLVICTAVSFLLIATLLTKNRARIKSAFNGLINGTSSTASTAAHSREGTYDDDKDPPTPIRLSTRHNHFFAYGQKQAVSTSAAIAETNVNQAYNIIIV